MDPFDSTDASIIVQALAQCLEDDRPDEAEALMQRLHDLHPATRSVLIFPVMIAIRRGRPHEAWQLVNTLPDDQSPELKALCLYVLQDPSWHSYATEHADSPNPVVRKAMRQLLGMPFDADVCEPA
ncbi:hypothetical protein CY652_04250 [Burkholderia sp. WAC0059]|uniref:HrpB1 family type III secretion system apparatus protein n=1 Tax=Burkholderia sp. WAC0059 TaxID=2066022 RepID=UPI000C7EAD79|nr:HrpB1 family type III secretion system apparatus protein [Burkholderia sp. WAC0059]PLZ03606.1 hypothetical protein CY652_04250 [Burkholderia sp. WAC0059]